MSSCNTTVLLLLKLVKNDDDVAQCTAIRRDRRLDAFIRRMGVWGRAVVGPGTIPGEGLKAKPPEADNAFCEHILGLF